MWGDEAFKFVPKKPDGVESILILPASNVQITLTSRNRYPFRPVKVFTLHDIFELNLLTHA